MAAPKNQPKANVVFHFGKPKGSGDNVKNEARPGVRAKDATPTYVPPKSVTMKVVKQAKAKFE